MDLMDVTLTRINKQTAEDPYASMEKDQLISMIHFLVKREDEPTNEASAEPNSFELCIARRRKNIIQRAQENQELKEKLLAKGAVVNCDETWCRSISYLSHVYRDV